MTDRHQMSDEQMLRWHDIKDAPELTKLWVWREDYGRLFDTDATDFHDRPPPGCLRLDCGAFHVAQYMPEFKAWVSGGFHLLKAPTHFVFPQKGPSS